MEVIEVDSALVAAATAAAAASSPTANAPVSFCEATSTAEARVRWVSLPGSVVLEDPAWLKLSVGHPAPRDMRVLDEAPTPSQSAKHGVMTLDAMAAAGLGLGLVRETAVRAFLQGATALSDAHDTACMGLAAAGVPPVTHATLVDEAGAAFMPRHPHIYLSAVREDAQQTLTYTLFALMAALRSDSNGAVDAPVAATAVHALLTTTLRAMQAQLHPGATPSPLTMAVHVPDVPGLAAAASATRLRVAVSNVRAWAAVDPSVAPTVLLNPTVQLVSLDHPSGSFNHTYAINSAELSKPTLLTTEDALARASDRDASRPARLSLGRSARVSPFIVGSGHQVAPLGMTIAVAMDFDNVSVTASAASMQAFSNSVPTAIDAAPAQVAAVVASNLALAANPDGVGAVLVLDAMLKPSPVAAVAAEAQTSFALTLFLGHALAARVMDDRRPLMAVFEETWPHMCDVLNQVATAAAQVPAVPQRNAHRRAWAAGTQRILRHMANMLASPVDGDGDVDMGPSVDETALSATAAVAAAEAAWLQLLRANDDLPAVAAADFFDASATQHRGEVTALCGALKTMWAVCATSPVTTSSAPVLRAASTVWGHRLLGIDVVAAVSIATATLPITLWHAFGVAEVARQRLASQLCSRTLFRVRTTLVAASTMATHVARHKALRAAAVRSSMRRLKELRQTRLQLHVAQLAPMEGESTQDAMVRLWRHLAVPHFWEFLTAMERGLPPPEGTESGTAAAAASAAMACAQRLVSRGGAVLARFVAGDADLSAVGVDVAELATFSCTPVAAPTLLRAMVRAAMRSHGKDPRKTAHRWMRRACVRATVAAMRHALGGVLQRRSTDTTEVTATAARHLHSFATGLGPALLALERATPSVAEATSRPPLALLRGAPAQAFETVLQAVGATLRQPLRAVAPALVGLVDDGLFAWWYLPQDALEPMRQAERFHFFSTVLSLVSWLTVSARVTTRVSLFLAGSLLNWTLQPRRFGATVATDAFVADVAAGRARLMTPVDLHDPTHVAVLQRTAAFLEAATVTDLKDPRFVAAQQACQGLGHEALQVPYDNHTLSAQGEAVLKALQGGVGASARDRVLGWATSTKGVGFGALRIVDPAHPDFVSGQSVHHRVKLAAIGGVVASTADVMARWKLFTTAVSSVKRTVRRDRVQIRGLQAGESLGVFTNKNTAKELMTAHTPLMLPTARGSLAVATEAADKAVEVEKMRAKQEATVASRRRRGHVAAHPRKKTGKVGMKKARLAKRVYVAQRSASGRVTGPQPQQHVWPSLSFPFSPAASNRTATTRRRIEGLGVQCSFNFSQHIMGCLFSHRKLSTHANTNPMIMKLRPLAGWIGDHHMAVPNGMQPGASLLAHHTLDTTRMPHFAHGTRCASIQPVPNFSYHDPGASTRIARAEYNARAADLLEPVAAELAGQGEAAALAAAFPTVAAARPLAPSDPVLYLQCCGFSQTVGASTRPGVSAVQAPVRGDCGGVLLPTASPAVAFVGTVATLDDAARAASCHLPHASLELAAPLQGFATALADVPSMLANQVEQAGQPEEQVQRLLRTSVVSLFAPPRAGVDHVYGATQYLGDRAVVGVNLARTDEMVDLSHPLSALTGLHVHGATQALQEKAVGLCVVGVMGKQYMHNRAFTLENLLKRVWGPLMHELTHAALGGTSGDHNHAFQALVRSEAATGLIHNLQSCSDDPSCVAIVSGDGMTSASIAYAQAVAAGANEARLLESLARVAPLELLEAADKKAFCASLGWLGVPVPLVNSTQPAATSNITTAEAVGAQRVAEPIRALPHPSMSAASAVAAAAAVTAPAVPQSQPQQTMLPPPSMTTADMFAHVDGIAGHHEETLEDIIGIPTTPEKPRGNGGGGGGSSMSHHPASDVYFSSPGGSLGLGLGASPVRYGGSMMDADVELDFDDFATDALMSAINDESRATAATTVASLAAVVATGAGSGAGTVCREMAQPDFGVPAVRRQLVQPDFGTLELMLRRSAPTRHTSSSPSRRDAAIMAATVAAMVAATSDSVVAAPRTKRKHALIVVDDDDDAAMVAATSDPVVAASRTKRKHAVIVVNDDDDSKGEEEEEKEPVRAPRRKRQRKRETKKKATAPSPTGVSSLKGVHWAGATAEQEVMRRILHGDEDVIPDIVVSTAVSTTRVVDLNAAAMSRRKRIVFSVAPLAKPSFKPAMQAVIRQLGRDDSGPDSPNVVHSVVNRALLAREKILQKATHGTLAEPRHRVKLLSAKARAAKSATRASTASGWLADVTLAHQGGTVASETTRHCDGGFRTIDGAAVLVIPNMAASGLAPLTVSAKGDAARAMYDAFTNKVLHARRQGLAAAIEGALSALASGSVQTFEEHLRTQRQKLEEEQASLRSFQFPIMTQAHGLDVPSLIGTTQQPVTKQQHDEMTAWSYKSLPFLSSNPAQMRTAVRVRVRARVRVRVRS